MPKNIQIEVKKLSLDLKNFRTVPQKTEKDAINAMITISPDRFFAVLDSIIDDGYIPTENIIVLRDAGIDIVREGNRRIACLKLIQGQYSLSDFAIPTAQLDKINSLGETWKKDNSMVPCIVFEKTEETAADKVVSLTHGKGEKANREKWSSVATARHNRDANGVPEPALDLLEEYLKVGNNLTNQQKERWGGDYPLTVLAEAIRTIYARLGYASTMDLVKAYPKINNMTGMEDLLRDVGLQQLTFKIIRDTQTDFSINYGIAPIIPVTPVSTPSAGITQPSTPPGSPNPIVATTPTAGGGAVIVTPSATPATPAPVITPAYAINDPRRVAAILKKFTPKGNRDKVVTLRDEIINLNIKKNPISFCFILRSMFEISAKSYCADNSLPTTTTNNGHTKDKTLLEILKIVTTHLTNNNTNMPVVKNLHGALAELAKPQGMLSVTSMNNLVHNPSFSVSAPDICTLFGNVYPLLEYMN